jgi:hypothetical protein
MSILAEKTEFRAVWLIAKSFKLLEGLDKFKVSKTDDMEISLAKNMMKSIIENNDPTLNIDDINI